METDLLRSLFVQQARLLTLQQTGYWESLKANVRYCGERSLIPHGRKMYSQNDEDGIIAEIFRRVGTTNRRFVEIGVGDGLENNTLALLHDGWHGAWIDADEAAARNITRGYAPVIESGRLKFLQAMVSTGNINDLLKAGVDDSSIDLLSIDIDGNDWHVFDAFDGVRARVVVIEYNARFAPPVNYCLDYDVDHRWDGSDCFGASLQFLESGFAKRDYVLVGCSLIGGNAFFVDRDIAADLFEQPYTALHHYEPARYFLSPLRSGHPASYATLTRAMER
jgi:hypothetical protein